MCQSIQHIFSSKDSLRIGDQSKSRFNIDLLKEVISRTSKLRKSSSKVMEQIQSARAQVFNPTILQTQVLRVEQVNESCIRVHIKELNRELCIELSTLYTKL